MKCIYITTLSSTDSIELPLEDIPAVSFVSVQGTESKGWGDSYSNTAESTAIVTMVRTA